MDATDRLRVAIAAPAQLNPYPVLFHRAVQAAAPDMHCDLWRTGLSWRRLLSKQRPDVLHLQWLELLFRHYRPLPTRLLGWLNLVLYVLVARLLSVRVVYTVHNVWQHEANGQWLYRAVHRLVLRWAEAVHVHSDSARVELLRTSRPGCPVVVIQHGNYVGWYENQISREMAREQLGLSETDFVYLSFGQVRPYKGLEELLRAFAEQEGENAVLLVVGRVQPPEYEARLGALVQDDQSVQYYLRYVPDDEVQLFMNAADVAVLSYRRATTSGAAILALSFGLPVIAPALGPFPELLSQGSGLLYDPSTPGALREALEQIRVMDRAALRKQAAEAADRLDWGPIGHELVSLYRSASRKR